MNAALTLSPSSRSRVGSSTSRKACGRLTPALLTRMSTRPRLAKASRTASERVTSSRSGRALRPPATISAATSSSSPWVRLTSTSSAPAAASASATARPMPRPAPVTSAIFPSSWKALSADFARIGFQQAPCRRARFFAPAGIKTAEFRLETRGIRSVDLHALARELFRAGGVDLLDVFALYQREFLGIAFDDVLDCLRQRSPRSSVGQQRKTRPPMGSQAQIGLHLVELQRQHDTERVALAVKVTSLQRIVHLVEWDVPRVRPECREEIACDRAARAADLQPGEIGGGVDRPHAARQMMKPVLQAMTEGMDPVLRQLAADPIA